MWKDLALPSAWKYFFNSRFLLEPEELSPPNRLLELESLIPHPTSPSLKELP